MTHGRFCDCDECYVLNYYGEFEFEEEDDFS